MMRSKYGARRVEIDGERFDSKAESRRWLELRILEAAGEIRELTRQVPFTLEVNGMRICRYVADFRYVQNAHPVIEDVKGVRTPVYKLKRKLMLACLGIDIREVE